MFAGFAFLSSVPLMYKHYTQKICIIFDTINNYNYLYRGGYKHTANYTNVDKEAFDYELLQHIVDTTLYKYDNTIAVVKCKNTLSSEN